MLKIVAVEYERLQLIPILPVSKAVFSAIIEASFEAQIFMGVTSENEKFVIRSTLFGERMRNWKEKDASNRFF